MRSLMIGRAEEQAIADLQRRAAAAPVRITRQPDASEAAAMRAMNETLTIQIPTGFQVTLTHEIQPAGAFRHISISVDDPRRAPHPAAVDMILKAFGMAPLADCPRKRIWIEQTPAFFAINVLQPLAANP